MRRVRVDTSTAAYCARASTARFGAASDGGSPRPPNTPARNGDGAAASSSSLAPHATASRARASGKTPWRYCCAASVARAFFLSFLLISRAKSPAGQNFRRSRGDLRALRFFQGRRRRVFFLEEGLRGLPMVGCSANLCADGPCGSFPYVARNCVCVDGLRGAAALRERLTSNWSRAHLFFRLGPPDEEFCRLRAVFHRSRKVFTSTFTKTRRGAAFRARIG